jgi:two-component system response regulator AtoC
MDSRVLVVDDERDFLDSVGRGLISSGFRNVRLEGDPNQAVALFEDGECFDIALIDVNMPGKSGMELLEVIKNTNAQTECLMVTAVNEARVAVECLKKGAYDYLVKPISRDDLVLAVRRALERRRLLDIVDLGKRNTVTGLIYKEAFKPIVTGSAKMLRMLKEAELHAGSDVPVLITGESGTGKELLARAIHSASPRAKFPFTPINMASLTGNLFEAEFFGHTKGAFTGAQVNRMGYLEQTNKGTLFLDEVGSLPLELQGKLLRVLQDGEYLKLGTSKLQRTDVRFIGATNTELDRLVEKGGFRKDLYYRLRGAWFHLPPLRERREDIPLLVGKFLGDLRGVSGNCGIEEEAISLLMDYDYPGNIRELRSILQAAVNLAKGLPISTHSLPSYLRGRKPFSKGGFRKGDCPTVPLMEVEKGHILGVYEQMGRNKVQTAKLLAIGLNTLRRKLASYGVE